ncbi:prepilin-type N-terminal cleavage/methylation domain-containing protein [Poseidonibacter ostreae]|uniref:Prepilin-type N-terminal cleavage/methylation domain-containing protein n=2 Tax=Poseidonibacter ostreae TaxID=2654171 RepID=A0A6L4WUK6_9BACT|nr:prepilin-type N-terminal cleavage/methylation domain-containing protein [Poseidonibacter ostreae]KAB7890225.1 prepilin-type N-terminal cleavage/methylation domain-containing protein [Poseidonibacter ostreae]
MKKGFSLLELIFAIVVIGIIASFAIPKYLDTRDSALVSTLKRDISTAITSIQSYHLQNGSISKISDAVTLNTTNWTIEDLKITYKDNTTDCAIIEVKESKLNLTVSADAGDICKKLDEAGIKTTSYDLF